MARRTNYDTVGLMPVEEVIKQLGFSDQAEQIIEALHRGKICFTLINEHPYTCCRWIKEAIARELNQQHEKEIEAFYKHFYTQIYRPDEIGRFTPNDDHYDSDELTNEPYDSDDGRGFEEFIGGDSSLVEWNNEGGSQVGGVSADGISFQIEEIGSYKGIATPSSYSGRITGSPYLTDQQAEYLQWLWQHYPGLFWIEEGYLCLGETITSLAQQSGVSTDTIARYREKAWAMFEEARPESPTKPRLPSPSVPPGPAFAAMQAHDLEWNIYCNVYHRGTGGLPETEYQALQRIAAWSSLHFAHVTMMFTAACERYGPVPLSVSTHRVPAQSHALRQTPSKVETHPVKADTPKKDGRRDRGDATRRRILETIRSLTFLMGYPPTIREIMSHLHSRSVNGIQRHIATLQANGEVRKGPNGRGLLLAPHIEAELQEQELAAS